MYRDELEAFSFGPCEPVASQGCGLILKDRLEVREDAEDFYEDFYKGYM